MLRSELCFNIKCTNTILHYGSYKIRGTDLANALSPLSLINWMRIRNIIARFVATLTLKVIHTKSALEGTNIVTIMQNIMKLMHILSLSHNSQQFQSSTIYNLYRLISFLLISFYLNFPIILHYQGLIYKSDFLLSISQKSFLFILPLFLFFQLGKYCYVIILAHYTY